MLYCLLMVNLSFFHKSISWFEFSLVFNYLLGSCTGKWSWILCVHLYFRCNCQFSDTQIVNLLRLSDAYMGQSTNHHWFRQWLVTWLAPSHYLNPCWNIVIWTLRNKLQWNLNRNSNIFMQENIFENVVWKMAAILSRPQCVILLVHMCKIFQVWRAMFFLVTDVPLQWSCLQRRRAQLF